MNCLKYIHTTFRVKRLKPLPTQCWILRSCTGSFGVRSIDEWPRKYIKFYSTHWVVGVNFPEAGIRFSTAACFWTAPHSAIHKYLPGSSCKEGTVLEAGSILKLAYTILQGWISDLFPSLHLVTSYWWLEIWHSWSLYTMETNHGFFPLFSGELVLKCTSTPLGTLKTKQSPCSYEFWTFTFTL